MFANRTRAKRIVREFQKAIDNREDEAIVFARIFGEQNWVRRMFREASSWLTYFRQVRRAGRQMHRQRVPPVNASVNEYKVPMKDGKFTEYKPEDECWN